MKTRIIIIGMTLGLLSLDARSQGMPVYDNTNFIALGKSLIESAKQTSQLLKTVNFLKEQKQRLEQVSDVIKQVRAVQQIIENNRQLFDLVQNDLREIISSPMIKPEEAERISVSFEAIISTVQEDVDFMQQLLSSNVLHMTDAERLTVLQAQKQRSEELLSEIELRTRRYRTIIAFREIQLKINRREINF